MTAPPFLPYPDGEDERTSGWSGSDTSHARAQRQDRSGKTGQLQTAALALLAASGGYGMTWVELQTTLRPEHPDIHHGTVSGLLSNLHKVGRAARLVDQRGGCKVYVLPSEVGDRLTEPFTRADKRRLTDDEQIALSDVRTAADNTGLVIVDSEALRQVLGVLDRLRAR